MFENRVYTKTYVFRWLDECEYVFEVNNHGSNSRTYLIFAFLPFKHGRVDGGRERWKESVVHKEESSAFYTSRDFFLLSPPINMKTTYNLLEQANNIAKYWLQGSL